MYNPIVVCAFGLNVYTSHYYNQHTITYNILRLCIWRDNLIIHYNYTNFVDISEINYSFFVIGINKNI